MRGGSTASTMRMESIRVNHVVSSSRAGDDLGKADMTAREAVPTTVIFGVVLRAFDPFDPMRWQDVGAGDDVRG